MNRSHAEIENPLSTFRPLDLAEYPVPIGYSQDDIDRDFFGDGLYLAIRMLHALNLQPGQVVLNLG